MHVTAPYIQPSVDTGLVGGSQWTAFVSILERWNATLGTWVAIHETEPYFHNADWVIAEPEYFYFLDPVLGWRHTTQGHTLTMAYKVGTQTVFPYGKGYFRIRHRFSWWDLAGTQVIGERTLGTDILDERAYPFAHNGWCYYG
jgi:hypothetical protein